MKVKPLSIKVRHWPNGYQHDHVGIDTHDALRHAMECSGHHMSRQALSTTRDVLERRGRFDFVVPNKGTEIFRLVHRGKEW